MIEKLFDKCNALLLKKGNDYSVPGECANANFFEIGTQSGTDALTVWAIFFLKHIKSIMKFIKGDKLQTESVESRIIDAINYLAILHTILNSMDVEKDL
jgi:hypothetical protein